MLGQIWYEKSHFLIWRALCGRIILIYKLEADINKNGNRWSTRKFERKWNSFKYICNFWETYQNEGFDYLTLTGPFEDTRDS